jgi:hypothetical protein
METSKLQKEFDRVAEVSSQLVLDLQNEVKDLRKKEVERVFMAVMEYPVPPSRPLTSQKEVDVYQMAVGLKEMQMKMGVINLAIKEQEQKDGEDNQSV